MFLPYTNGIATINHALKSIFVTWSSNQFIRGGLISLIPRTLYSGLHDDNVLIRRWNLLVNMQCYMLKNYQFNWKIDIPELQHICQRRKLNTFSIKWNKIGNSSKYFTLWVLEIFHTQRRYRPISTQTSEPLLCGRKHNWRSIAQLPGLPQKRPPARELWFSWRTSYFEKHN